MRLSGPHARRSIVAHAAREVVGKGVARSVRSPSPSGLSPRIILDGESVAASKENGGRSRPMSYNNITHPPPVIRSTLPIGGGWNERSSRIGFGNAGFEPREPDE